MALPGFGALVGSSGGSLSLSDQKSFDADVEASSGLGFGSYYGGAASSGSDGVPVAASALNNPWLLGGLFVLGLVYISRRGKG